MWLIFFFVFLTILVIAIIYAKSSLYIYEHESSINAELKKFDSNFKELSQHTEKEIDYELSGNHLYE
jgi:uncharacterized membrane protein